LAWLLQGLWDQSTTFRRSNDELLEAARQHRLVGALAFANGAFAQTTTETTTSTSGTFSAFTPKTIVIKTTTTPDPMPYTYTRRRPT